MKKLFLAIIIMLGFTIGVNAQSHTKKDGSPDMRFKENRNPYGTVRTYDYTSPKPTYTPSIKPYEPTYKTIYTPPFPTNTNGTPDMRYNSNKSLYGKPN